MAKQRILVCPICGETQPEIKVCRVCSTLLDTNGLLLAEGAIGPWWVRKEELTFRPGITYDNLAELALSGKITLQTIVRGPTTRQLWKVARRVKGLSHLLGRCHNCGEHVSPDDRTCDGCNAQFLKFTDRNNMGIELGAPSKGETGGMSSFLSDAEILDTQSTPLTLPPKPEVQQSPESVETDEAEESVEESVGSPQFRSLQRRLEQGKRRVLALTISLIIALILIGILISTPLG
ncbi:MAG TPA: hypothetical protein EYO01_03320 [Phycisphaerales bacterium]|nr:hypothetical protein [Phycisphaerales bacterium]HIB50938.1 hypothetical protein [Phycisphaerales bacterium]HIO19878.1 hypothetical protein [Phycisphaerales bacterium]